MRSCRNNERHLTRDILFRTNNYMEEKVRH